MILEEYEDKKLLVLVPSVNVVRNQGSILLIAIFVATMDCPKLVSYMV
jgi:hypothetical protein